jgi:cell division protein FtsW (lipid II flippase)
MADETTAAPAAQPEEQQVSPQTSEGSIKKRNPILVLVFTIITLGIYGIYWVVSTTHELQKTTSSAPKAWWIILSIIPIVGLVVMLVFYWKYSKAVNELTGFSTGGLFALWILLSPVAMVLTQIHLNEKATE